MEKDLPEYLSFVLDRTEEYITNNETNIKDLQGQFVVLDRTVRLLSSIAFDTRPRSDRVGVPSYYSCLFISTTGYQNSDCLARVDSVNTALGWGIVVSGRQ